MNKIVLNANNIDKTILDEFIQALENASGCRVITETVYELTCDDAKTAAILQTVFGGNGHAAIAKTKQKKENKPGQPENTAIKRSRIDVTYEVLDGPQKGMRVKPASLA